MCECVRVQEFDRSFVVTSVNQVVINFAVTPVKIERMERSICEGILKIKLFKVY